MKNFKLLSLITALVLAVNLVPICALAAQGGTDGEISWSVEGTKLTISPASGVSKAEMKNYDDNNARPPWYQYKSNITSITIASGVTQIGNYAFFEMTNVKSVTFNSTVLKKISPFAFSFTGITSITVPESVTTVGYAAYYGCGSLKEIYFNAKNCETMTGSNTQLVFGKTSSVQNIYIGSEVQRIPDYIFAMITGVTSVDIMNTRVIGESAFQSCTGLKTITTSGKLYSIKSKAFKGCTALGTFSVPKLLTEIGEEAFANCSSLASMDLTYHVTTIGGGAFDGTNITINTTTDAYAYEYCKIYGTNCNANSASYGDITTPSVDLYVDFGDVVLQSLNGKLIIDVTFDKTLTKECLHMAFYDSNDTVVDYVVLPINRARNDVYAVMTNGVANAKYAKIFVWDSLTTLRPVSPIKKVNITTAGTTN